MKLVDANVLLYAVNTDATRHAEAKDWLKGSLNGRTTVGLSWIVLLAVLRLSTHPAIFPQPLSVDDALATVRGWVDARPAVIVEPTSRHLDILAALLTEVGAGGNLTSDAHLAALAIEHDATVVTYDADFARFDGVRWATPAA